MQILAIHTVKKGDTLGKIARHYYADKDKFGVIARANNLANPDHIWVGRQLQIPELNETDYTWEAGHAPEIDKQTFRLDLKNYYQEKYHKDMIVLHFTAGATASGAYTTFSRRGHVATPFIVDRSGVIYQLFEPYCWAYHLGVGARDNPGHMHDKRSVAIEIVNPGPLRVVVDKGRAMKWWPEDYNAHWCMVEETDKYVHVPEGHKGFFCYASFTNEQYKSVSALVRYLADRMGIPLQVLAPADRYDADLNFMQDFKGIATHENFRPDKYDLGPAWNWQLFETYVSSNVIGAGDLDESVDQNNEKRATNNEERKKWK